MTRRSVVHAGTDRGAWMVVAPYRQPRCTGELEPWGTVHLRREGALVSACGQPASTWHTFWNHAFEPAGEASCGRCWATMRSESWAAARVL